jgi:hypothetical protein
VVHKDSLHRLHFIVNTKKTVYSVYMPAKGKTALNLNIDPELLARIDKYRFKRMFASRTEAIEFLLEAALKMNPDRPTAKAD